MRRAVYRQVAALLRSIPSGAWPHVELIADRFECAAESFVTLPRASHSLLMFQGHGGRWRAWRCSSVGNEVDARLQRVCGGRHQHLLSGVAAVYRPQLATAACGLRGAGPQVVHKLLTMAMRCRHMRKQPVRSAVMLRVVVVRRYCAGEDVLEQAFRLNFAPCIVIRGHLLTLLGLSKQVPSILASACTCLWTYRSWWGLHTGSLTSVDSELGNIEAGLG
jgi:hypothetical protein